MTCPPHESPAPRIAAIETSGRVGSVSLGLGPALLTGRTLSANLRHAVELMPALESLCLEQGWLTPRGSAGAAATGLNLQHVYLSLGPGSFTGLRIAVAIARSLAQAIGCRLVGVPSLDVIAQNAPAQYHVVVPVLDAKRGQVFAARYQRDPATGALHRTAGPALVDPATFMTQAVEQAAGQQVAVLGEGVDYHRPAFLSPAAAPGQIAELEKALWYGRAPTVHRLGWQKACRGEFTDPQSLLPIYIRLPEAEELWRMKHGQPAE